MFDAQLVEELNGAEQHELVLYWSVEVERLVTSGNGLKLFRFTSQFHV